MDIGRRRIVLAGVFLGDEQNLLVVLHDVFQGMNRLLASHEEGHDHVGKDDDVP
jgi:hypothetical protein